MGVYWYFFYEKLLYESHDTLSRLLCSRADSHIELITHLAFYSGWPNAMSAITFHSPIALYPCHVRGRPTRDELPQPVQRVGKFLAYGCEAKAEMRRHIEAIPRCEQDAPLCGGLAEGAAVFSA